jgi:hypothetical protein
MQKKTTINLLIVALVMLFSSTAQAQFPNHVKGDIIIKGSVGLPFTDGTKFTKTDGIKYINNGMPMFMQGSLDYAISNHMDLGLFGGMGMAKIDVVNNGTKANGISSTYMGGGARIIYHLWGKARWKWDPYVLLGGGMVSESHEVEIGNNDDFGVAATRVIYTARAGVNYYFTPTFGLHAEGGYGISYGSIGMQLRF